MENSLKDEGAVIGGAEELAVNYFSKPVPKTKSLSCHDSKGFTPFDAN